MHIPQVSITLNIKKGLELIISSKLIKIFKIIYSKTLIHKKTDIVMDCVKRPRKH